MRFFILSDLHLSADKGSPSAERQVKKLCAKIRTDTDLNECILFILLGDIADRGNPQSFSVGRNILALIKTELNEYTVQFMFTPGNHDLCNKSLFEFDKFTSEFGFPHNYENSPAYAYTFDDTNFIFVDSNVHSDYNAPGNINIAAIKAKIRPGITNILFFHHLPMRMRRITAIAIMLLKRLNVSPVCKRIELTPSRIQRKFCQQLHLLISLSLSYQFILLQTSCHWHFTKNFQTYCIKTVANSYSIAYNNSEP